MLGHFPLETASLFPSPVDYIEKFSASQEKKKKILPNVSAEAAMSFISKDSHFNGKNTVYLLSYFCLSFDLPHQIYGSFYYRKKY